MFKIILLTIFLFVLNEISFSQENIIVEGNGISCKDATNNALINAINKAYGSLMSSEKKFINKKVISKEINSLTSGNILNYEEIKSCSESKGNWSIKLKVTVSQTELKKFIEGKGKSVSISGELLKQKIDQEISSTKSELSIIENLLNQLESLSRDPFDFDINISNITIKDFHAEITVKSNPNFYNIYLKMNEELDKITINKTDQSFRIETMMKNNYPIEINSKTYILRNKESIQQIKDFYLKIISKMDNYIVVDGCLKEMYLTESKIKTNLYAGKLYFPNPGFIAKTIDGSFSTSIEEIGSLERINIFSSDKLMEFKNGNSLSNELNLLKYSETNPIEYEAVKDNLLKTVDSLSKDKEDGQINFIYNIKFSKEGFNNSSFENINISNKNYRQILETSVNQIKLHPSKLCGSYTKTYDSIYINFKWNSVKSNFLFLNSEQSKYSDYLRKQGLPNGKYLLVEKNKVLNNNRSKIIYITNYKVRGPLTAFYSLIIPGWGSNRVTYGDNSGKGHFALVIAPIALSFLTKVISNAYYSKYLNSSDPTEIERFYQNANYINKTSVVFKTIGATFYLYDFIWVINKGFSNISKKNKINQKIKSTKYEIEYQE